MLVILISSYEKHVTLALVGEFPLLIILSSYYKYWTSTHAEMVAPQYWRKGNVYAHCQDCAVLRRFVITTGPAAATLGGSGMKIFASCSANNRITMPDAEEIIRRQRQALGKPDRSKPRAVDLVLNNEPVIRQLREAGYKQEDAVLLLLAIGGENHKPDTLRKAIAAVLGPWSNPVDHAAGAFDTSKAEDDPSERELAEHKTGGVEVPYDNTVDEGDVI